MYMTFVGIPQALTRVLTLFFTWWNSENRVFILPQPQPEEPYAE